MMIFLMGLLCLVSNGGEAFSQNCFKISYDKDGNRICFWTIKCSGYYRGNVEDDIETEKLCENENDDIVVYPNPSNGRFRVELKSYGNDALAEAYVYDNKGILLNVRKITGKEEVDISDYPAGTYLLRVIANDEVRSMVVVKL